MTLPPWESSNDRDKLAMTRWVNHELNLMDVQELRKDIKGENALDPSNRIAWAMEQADAHISIEPLRQAFPELARFLQLPKRAHGKRGAQRGYNHVKGVARDVKRIRALWRKHYGNKRRTRDMKPTAEEIAVARWRIE